MSGYRIEKKDKHEHASPAQKLYRRLHKLFYRICGSEEAAYPFYRSWRHRKHTPKQTDGAWEHYMTGIPVYLAGFGHGLGSWRAGLVNAKLFGLSYAYSPMVTKSWDDTLGLGEGLVSADELLRRGYKKVRLPYYHMDSEKSVEKMRMIFSSYRGENVVFYNEYEQWTKGGDDILGDEMIREMFWRSSRRKQDKLRYPKACFCVAVHVRRGDVSSRLAQGDESMRQRWLELSYYRRLMEQIRQLYQGSRTLHFYVFSDGSSKELAELCEGHDDVELCLKMSEEESFLHLCHADMLLVAPSSFSIIAGAINRGLKLIPDKDWLHYPEGSAEWIPVREENGLDETGIKRMGEVLC